MHIQRMYPLRIDGSRNDTHMFFQHSTRIILPKRPMVPVPTTRVTGCWRKMQNGLMPARWPAGGSAHEQSSEGRSECDGDAHFRSNNLVDIDRAGRTTVCSSSLRACAYCGGSEAEPMAHATRNSVEPHLGSDQRQIKVTEVPRPPFCARRGSDMHDSGCSRVP